MPRAGQQLATADKARLGGGIRPFSSPSTHGVTAPFASEACMILAADAAVERNGSNASSSQNT